MPDTRGVSALVHPVPAGMRDLLPPEARRHADLERRLVQAFELHGYELVAVPLFEFAEVVERGLGGFEAHEVLRFVEPESGAVVSLRPDMTPQVARLVATRLADAPPPARLCYRGAVLRRRHERARRHRQIPQAGLELIGCDGPEGDLEVLSAAAFAARAAGLADFVIDLGHARIATALVGALAPEQVSEILEALEVKDESEVVRRAERHGLRGVELAALAALPLLHGGAEVWPKAKRLLSGTVAWTSLLELERLWEAACAAELAPNVLVDLGETRDFAYYTGALFQIHAEGPGRAIGAGGRYDGLLERFGRARPAVGFAFRIDDLAWALEKANAERPLAARVLLVGGAKSLADALRGLGLCTAVAPSSDGLAHARAWRYSHLVCERDGRLCLVGVGTEDVEVLPSEREALIATVHSRLSVSPGV